MIFTYGGFRFDGQLVGGCPQTYDSPAEGPELEIERGWLIMPAGRRVELTQARLQKIVDAHYDGLAKACGAASVAR